MNILSREMKLNQIWKNSSGLQANSNLSSPKAISCLTLCAMMNEKFREIVSCKHYELDIKNDRLGIRRKVIWKNTNKLLDCGW
jgi:hypothetical protein